MASPTRAIKIRNVVNNVDNNKIIPYTSNKALAFLIENKLTKQQYLYIGLGAKKKNCDLYPPYASILEAKKSVDVAQDLLVVAVHKNDTREKL